MRFLFHHYMTVILQFAVWGGLSVLVFVSSYMFSVDEFKCNKTIYVGNLKP